MTEILSKITVGLYVFLFFSGMYTVYYMCKYRPSNSDKKLIKLFWINIPLIVVWMILVILTCLSHSYGW